VLNQVSCIKDAVNKATSVFCPEVLRAFERIAGREYVWMDLLYRPQRFLEYDSGDIGVSLDQAVSMTGFVSKIIDFRSPFTAMHSAGVAATAVCLAQRVGMSEDECKMMRIAGNLHDIGKLKIPNYILEKPGKLTDQEFNVMKEHTYYTYVLLKDIQGFEQIAQWAAFHHEKFNGGGYPFHLGQNEISLGSRIMAVADIFSAITEDRPYRKGMEKEKAIQILRGDAEKGLISATIVELLVNSFDEINRVREEESRTASKSYQQSLQRG
jgi:HD-GYP domain-containing protein (c-di-GMP phosphodiesterase class II)